VRLSPWRHSQVRSDSPSKYEDNLLHVIGLVVVMSGSITKIRNYWDTLYFPDQCTITALDTEYYDKAHCRTTYLSSRPPLTAPPPTAPAGPCRVSGTYPYYLTKESLKLDGVAVRCNDTACNATSTTQAHTICSIFGWAKIRVKSRNRVLSNGGDHFTLGPCSEAAMALGANDEADADTWCIDDHDFSRFTVGQPIACWSSATNPLLLGHQGITAGGHAKLGHYHQNPVLNTWNALMASRFALLVFCCLFAFFMLMF
jgi:hypothetical protein